jgi:phosphoribosylaminoimidazolecarboxamide formyltransferase/IMP cyclohydrolase
VGARSHVLARVSQLHGKELSFINVLDLDSARKLLGEFSVPACVIVKHNNPCGAAIGETAELAYDRALRTDPLSAFGGVIAFNRPVDQALAEKLHQNFVEVLIAPGFDQAALVVLEQKEAIRILENQERRDPTVGERDLKRVRGGLLVQDFDTEHEERELMEVVTQARPSEAQWGDLLFAWRVAKHVRSNAIVLAKDLATVGVGAGQMSRVDSVRLAIEKAQIAFEAAAGEALSGSVMASDAFFPFADGPETAIQAGVRAIIQPGGSRRDEEVIAACDAAGVAMAFTKRRHFRH